MIPSLQSAVTDRRLSALDVRVLAHLHTELDLVEPRRAKQLAIARQLDVHYTNVYRSILHLLSYGYLNAGPDDGRRHTYLLVYAAPLCRDASRPAA